MKKLLDKSTFSECMKIDRLTLVNSNQVILKKPGDQLLKKPLNMLKKHLLILNLKPHLLKMTQGLQPNTRQSNMKAARLINIFQSITNKWIKNCLGPLITLQHTTLLKTTLTECAQSKIIAKMPMSMAGKSLVLLNLLLHFRHRAISSHHGLDRLFRGSHLVFQLRRTLSL